MLTSLIALPLLLTGCGYKQLQADVFTLTQELSMLQAEVDTLKGAQPEGLDAEAALALFEVYDAQLGTLATAEAAETLEVLLTSYPGTREWQYAQKLSSEYAVIGQPAPALDGVDWFGEAPADSAITVLLFWEVWCPHCRDEMPRMQARHKVLSEQGLKVVGLTRLSRETTQEEAEAFMAENDVTFAVGMDDGAVTEAMGVRGVPAAAVVADGVVVWRGHPSKINWDVLESRLSAEE